jgi:hypothetical protein
VVTERVERVEGAFVELEQCWTMVRASEKVCIG